MKGGDDTKFDLISESAIGNQGKCQSVTRHTRFHGTVIAFEFVVIIVLVSFIVVREEYFKQELNMESTTTVMPSQVSSSKPKADPINSICFPCEEIGDNVTNNDIGNIIRLEKKTNMCCMDQIGNLKKLFLLIINEYYRNAVSGLSSNGKNAGSKHQENLEAVGPVAGHIGSGPTSTAETITFWKQREDAAHMFLDSRRLKSSSEAAPRIPWDRKDNHNLSMADHLVVYHPDKRSIQVTDSGLYFIYSSITFQAPQTNLNAQVYHTLLREHYLLPNTGATMLMINKYGGGTQSTGFYTSFLCGAFKLRAGDEVFVQVSNKSFVYNSYYSNYLGLYRL